MKLDFKFPDRKLIAFGYQGCGKHLLSSRAYKVGSLHISKTSCRYYRTNKFAIYVGTSGCLDENYILFQ